MGWGSVKLNQQKHRFLYLVVALQGAVLRFPAEEDDKTRGKQRSVTYTIINLSGELLGTDIEGANAARKDETIWGDRVKHRGSISRSERRWDAGTSPKLPWSPGPSSYSAQHMDKKTKTPLSASVPLGSSTSRSLHRLVQDKVSPG